MAAQAARARVAMSEAAGRGLTAYLQHRKAYQRVLMLGFTFYVIQTTISGLSPKPRKASPASKAEGAEAAGASPGAGPPRRGRSSKRGGSTSSRRSDIDADFFHKLGRILRIVIPSVHSREASLLLIHSSFLVGRTLLSLYVATLDGAIVAALVRRQGRAFLLRILVWLAIAWPATYCNSMISYLQSKLSIAFRSRLTKQAHTKYLEDTTFYSLGNLDDRIQGADQLIAADIAKLSNGLAEVYSNLAKPMLDVVLYNYQLSRSVGAEGLIALTVIVQLSAALLKKLTPPFGRLAAEEARLEGQFRTTHTKLITSAEEVAFLRGASTEKAWADRAYFQLIKHVNRVFRMRFWHGVVEEGIVKWFWGSLGLLLCSVPVFVTLPGRLASVADFGGRTEGFVTNRRLLLSASDAMGRLMSTYRELSELSGYTARVSDLFDTMDDLKRGNFHKKLVSSASTEENAKVLQGRGTIVRSDGEIVFDKVPIVTPNGDVLIREMSFVVKPGQNLLVVGGNGCGKSSMFRLLGGLWPLYGGTLRAPPPEQFQFLAQRPLVTVGTLRQQLIYPAQSHLPGKVDADLLEIVELLEISDLVRREGGLDVTKDWNGALSGGDKQRLAMVRILYHRPAYGILDECTSAVTLEVEKLFYDRIAELGITALTVSHRPSLWRYHSHILSYDGQGGYTFGPLNAEKRLALVSEKQELEAKLAEVPKLQARLDALRAIKRPPSSSGIHSLQFQFTEA